MSLKVAEAHLKLLKEEAGAALATLERARAALAEMRQAEHDACERARFAEWELEAYRAKRDGKLINQFERRAMFMQAYAGPLPHILH